MKTQDVWSNRETFTTSLLILWLDSYVVNEDVSVQRERLQWSATTIQREIEADFDVRLPDACLHRLMSGILLMTTNFFFLDSSIFMHVCNVLSDPDFDQDIYDIADVDECAWGITEALLINPPGNDEQVVFGQSVIDYVGGLLEDEGIAYPPDVLQVGNLPDSIQANIQSWQGSEHFQAISDVQQRRSEAITATVKTKLKALLEEVSQLPLRHGKVDSVVEMIRRSGSEYQ